MSGDAGGNPEILAKEKIPPQLVTKNIWRERFEDISAVERYLARNGTVILKFFLNVSKEEQRARFSTGSISPRKTGNFRWAISRSARCGRDIRPCIRRSSGNTSTAMAPWVCGAGRPQMVRAGGDRFTIVSALEKLDLKFPKVDKGSLEEFKEVRKALLEEGKGGGKAGAK